MFVAGWRHALRSEWPFIIIITKKYPSAPSVLLELLNTIKMGKLTCVQHTLRARDPSARDPSARDPSACDPSARDPSACDPSARDLSARDSSARDP